MSPDYCVQVALWTPEENSFILKIDRKERNFGHASSVNVEFSFFSGVHIAHNNLGLP